MKIDIQIDTSHPDFQKDFLMAVTKTMLEIKEFIISNKNTSESNYELIYSNKEKTDGAAGVVVINLKK